MTILTARRISAALFMPYGDLISSAGEQGVPVNEGRGSRIETGAALVHGTSADRPTLALFRLEASRWPVPVRVMERHRNSAQMFLPLSGGSFLVVVADTRANGGPDPATAAAFVGAPGQGIVYAPGIWHLPLAALDQPAEFAMLMWENGLADDCDVRRLAIPLIVQPPPEP